MVNTTETRQGLWDTSKGILTLCRCNGSLLWSRLRMLHTSELSSYPYSLCLCLHYTKEQAIVLVCDTSVIDCMHFPQSTHLPVIFSVLTPFAICKAVAWYIFSSNSFAVKLAWFISFYILWLAFRSNSMLNHSVWKQFPRWYSYEEFAPSNWCIIAHFTKTIQYFENNCRRKLSNTNMSDNIHIYTW